MGSGKVSYIFSFILLVIIGCLGYFAYNKLYFQTYTTNYYEDVKGRVIVKVNGKELTDKGIEYYRNYINNDSDLSDKDLTELFIENRLLLEKAIEDEIRVSKKEVIKRVNNRRHYFENSATKEEKDALNKMVEDQQISMENYWSKYAPEVYAQLIAVDKVKNTINSINIEVLKRLHPEWSEEELNEENDKLFNNKIYDLKIKYNVEIVRMY